MTNGETVGDGGTSVGVIVADGTITVSVGDGIIVCVGGCVGSRVTAGDNVSLVGLHAAKNSTTHRNAFEIVTRIV